MLHGAMRRGHDPCPARRGSQVPSRADAEGGARRRRMLLASPGQSEGYTPLAIAQRLNQHGARDCLQGWLQMSVEQRDVIISYCLDYFELPTWRLREHSEFPVHLRAQVHAVAVSLADMHIAPVLELIAKGIDSLKRKRALEI